MKLSKINYGKKNKKNHNQNKPKLGKDLVKHFGVIKDDTEYKKLEKEIKAGWRRWTKRYN